MSIQRSGSADYDVAILGTGIGGSMLGAILARHGQRVLLIEQGSHPRFAIGESTIPETTIMLRLMATRFGVPEIGYLSNFNAIRQNISTNCGVKRNFSFIYHRPGEPNRAEETTQFPTWAPPFGPDVHFFRQDIDAYMLAVAVGYGAIARQQTEIAEVDFHSSAVELHTCGGETFRAQYIIDAGGMKAMLPQQLATREDPCPLKTRSRTLYTHMVRVAPYDRAADRSQHLLPSPLCQGTLHHLFDGGWMWVIPFDNHPTSTNSLCSVGLTLDTSRYPKSSAAPQDEFNSLIARFPSIAQQFADARPIRTWMATDRLQYSSTQVAGDRYCLLPHAAAFVDPLFSSGLAITMSAVNLIAARLIQAKSDGDYSAERFRYVDTWVKNSFAYYDRLVSNAYTAFGSFELWNAWHRIWMIGSLYGVSGLFEIWSRNERTGDRDAFIAFEKAPYRGVQAIDFGPYQDLFKRAAVEVEAVAAGRLNVTTASGRIYELIRASGLGPEPWKLDDPGHRCPGTFTLLPMMRLVAWGRYHSPESVRRHYFIGGRTEGLFSDLWNLGKTELAQTGNTAFALLRDSLVSWNRDWTRARPGVTATVHNGRDR